MEQQVNLYQPIRGVPHHLFSSRSVGMGFGALALCLALITGFGIWRTHKAEQAVAQLERDQVAALSKAERLTAEMKPKQSVAELDTDAKLLAADIASRERALDTVRKGSATPEGGFAARLEALARRQLDGLWLRAIVLASGDSRLALEGATTDPRLVPAYLAALSEERALDGARFDRLNMREAKPDESPARTIFEAGGAGLALPVREPKP